MNRYLSGVFAQQLDSGAYRQVFDEGVLVSLDRSNNAVRASYTLNPIANRIWMLLDGQRRGEEICDLLALEFDADPDVIAADLIELLQQLERLGLITPVLQT